MLLSPWQRRLFLVALVCLFVSLLATLLKHLCTDCDEILWRGAGW